MSGGNQEVGRLPASQGRVTDAAHGAASRLHPDGSVPTDAERAALEKCVGALQFILAFYDPGQRYLDTEAWKVACASGVAAYLEGAAAIGWPGIPYRADNGSVYRDKRVSA